MTLRLAAACLLGWAATTNYTNHAAIIPLLMTELAFGPVQAGVLSMVFFVTLGVSCVPAGLLSDRHGPTGVGTVGIAAVLASNLLLGYARHFPDLLLIKVVGGLGCGLAFVAGMRYAALVVPPARVHRALGIYGGLVQLGGGTSLYLIPLLTSLVGWRGAFVVSSGLIALSGIAWLALAPRVRPSQAAAPLTEAARNRTVWTLGLVHTATFGLAVLVGIWVTTFLAHDFGLSLVSAGAAGSAILALGVISRPLGGWLIDRGVVSAGMVMKLTVLGGAAGLAVLAWPGRPLAVAALAICALGVAFNAPYAAVMNTTGAVLPRAPGAAVGLVSGLGVIAIAVGAPVVGALFASTGGFTVPFGALAVFSLLVFWALFSL
ncbi:MAG TPA: MFS transporter [Methylomirabilota bacterium]|jgi:NNP family nitrate/nitrite transporter-like MFS transporter